MPALAPFTWEEATAGPTTPVEPPYSFEEAQQSEGGETLSPQERQDWTPETAPKKQGFVGSLARGFVEPIKATAKGVGVGTLSDETLQNALNAEWQKNQNAAEPTTGGKVGGFVGGLAGTLTQSVPLGAAFGLPGIVAQFGSAGAYDSFMSAGQKALEQGKSLAEATEIGKKASGVGAVLQGLSAIVMGGGGGAGIKPIIKEAIRGALGMGGAKLGENKTEQQLGLPTPTWEGVPEAALTGALLPPGMHAVKLGAQAAIRALSRAPGGGRVDPTAAWKDRAVELANQETRTPEEEAELMKLDSLLFPQGAAQPITTGAPNAVPESKAESVYVQPTPADRPPVAAGERPAEGAAPIRPVQEVAPVAPEPDEAATAAKQRAADDLAQPKAAEVPLESDSGEQAKAGGIKKVFDQMAQGIKEAGRKKIVDDLAAGKDVRFFNPASIDLLRKDPTLVLRDNPDGSVSVISVKESLTVQPAVKETAPTEVPVKPVPINQQVETGGNVNQPATDLHKDLLAVIGMNGDGREKGAAIRALAEKHGLTVKAAQEAIEAEMVRQADGAVGSTMTPGEKQQWARIIYERQPTLSARTSTSVANQAYSTPLPLAQALSHAIGVDRKTPVYEPTAGNGMLMIGADLGASQANEIEPGRAAALKKLGVGTVTENDATQYTPHGKFAKVLANPPFGGIDNQNYGGYGIKRLEHLISLKALEAMEDNGQAAIILGAKREPGESGKGAQWVFENYLYGHYNVIGNFEVSGDLYAKQGAKWPVRVLVIDGRRVNAVGGELAPKTVARFSTWDEVWQESERLRHEIELRRQVLGNEPGLPLPPARPAAPTDQPGIVPGVSDRPVAKAGRGGKPAGGRVRQPETGEQPAAEPAGLPPARPLSRPEDEPAPAPEPSGGRGTAPRLEDGGSRGAEAKANVPRPSEVGSGEPKSGSVSGPAPVARAAGNLDGLSEADLDSMLEEASKPSERESVSSVERKAAPAKRAPAASPTPVPPALSRDLAKRLQSGRGGVLPDQPKAPAPTKTASDILGEAAKAGVKGADEALKGLHDLFGGGANTLAGLPVFDEKTYAKAKPHFEQAYESFKASGKSLQEFFQFIFRQMGESVKPYLKRFVQDLQAKAREPLAPPPTKVPQVEATEHQVNYEPRSQATPFGTLTPRSSAAGVHDSLDKLQARVGPIDDFVANRLNMQPEEVRKVMAAEQVDGVALAIDQIEQGGALIIGDETGIGKGRQGAAVIRYAILQGKIPIFFTKDPKLFTDMYGDLLDIHTEIKPFIMGDPGKASIVDAEGGRIHRAPGGAGQKAEMQRIEDEGWENSGYNAIFATYSQVNVRNARQMFLERLAQNNDTIMVMDEAHEAAGDATSSMQAAFMTGGTIVRGSGSDRTTIMVPGLLQADGTRKGRGGVVYLSATYAKRSENMPVYFRTSLSKAADSFTKIVAALKRGGVAMQQAVSEALSAAGQYVRRERDFTGVSYGMKKVAVADEAALVEHVDQVTDVLSEIVEFSHQLSDKVEGATAQSGAQIDMTDFAAIVHNQVGQLLLAAKADAVVEEAIAAHRRGEKPVIALMNTMESFLGHFADDHGIKPGQPITLRWNELLKHALKRTLRVSEKLANGDTEISEINPSDYGLQEAYDAVVKLAEAIESKFPVSPIDYIIQKLAKAGVKMAELTGRESGVEYLNPEAGEGVYRRFKRANKNAVVNGFNDDTYNGMLLNASGSTGLSAHASVKFKAQQPRHMIIAQPALDINVFVQTLGRIKRTGMVMLGKNEAGQPYGARYSHLVLPLQAEIRPAAMAARKMKSLNANTTAETNNAIKIEAEDMFNRYGDEIVAEYLDENRDLQHQVGIGIGQNQDGSLEVPKDVARKFTGRMALRPDAEQLRAYDHILTAYRDKIEQLKQTGEYDLEVVLHDDWDAKQHSDTELSPGTDESNIFTASTRVQSWEIRDSRHVPTGEEMQRELGKRGGKDKIDELWLRSRVAVDDALGAKFQKASEKMKAAKTDSERALYQEQLNRLVEQRNRWNHLSDRVGEVVDTVGQVVELHNEESGERYDGTLLEGRFGTGTGPSNFKLRFVVENPGGMVYLTGADLLSGKWTVERSAKEFADLTGARAGARTSRYFITGNPIRGYEATGGRGKIVRFKAQDGSTVTGLLMPSNWGPEKLASDPRAELVNGKAAEHFLRNHSFVAGSRESIPLEAAGIVRIGREAGNYVITTPSSRRTGGDIFLDPALRGLVDGGDFTKRGLRMVADLPDRNLVKAVDRIMAITSSRFKPVGKPEALIPRVQDSNRTAGGVAAMAAVDAQIAAQKKLAGSAANDIYRNLGTFGGDPVKIFRYYKEELGLMRLYLKKGFLVAGDAVEKFADLVGRKVNAVMAKAWGDATGGTEESDPSKLPGLSSEEAKAISPERVTTQVMGSEMGIGSRPGASAEADAAAIAHQHQMIEAAGDNLAELVRPAERGTVTFEPDGFLHEAGGQNLVEHIRSQLPANWDGDMEKMPYQLTPLFQSLRQEFQNGNLAEVFGEPLARRLFSMAQAPISHWGLMLQSVQRFGNAIIDVAHDPLVHLRYEWGKMFGGESYDNVFDRVMRDLTDRLGPEAGGLLREHPEVNEFVDAVIRRNMLDQGGRVYRKVQYLFKPKSAKKLAQLTGDARFMEAVGEILQQLKEQHGLEPKPRPGKKALDPKEQLLYLASPEIAGKVDDAIRRALREGERNAARAGFQKEEGLHDDEMRSYDDRTHDPEAEGPDPTPEQVDAGLLKPAFAHWGKLRSTLADYSPVTLDLAQRVLRGDFKGTKFKPPPAKAAEMRIDLGKLAKSLDAEVERVLGAWRSALGEAMDLNGAAPETRMRIEGMMRDELAGQLERVRKQARDPLFADKVKRGAPLTPEERMLQLVNAKLFADPRLDIPAMVEKVAGKPAVNNLLPTMAEMMGKVFATPFFDQSELKTRFVSNMVDKLGIEPAQADKAWAVFERAFAGKFAEAKRRAAEKAVKELTPQEKRTFQGRGIVEKIQRNINAGNLDSADVLQDVALKRGMRVPSEADVAKIKSLGEREMRLRTLSDAEKAELRAVKASPEQIEAARAEKENSTGALRSNLKREMSVLWSTMAKPLTARSLTSAQGLRNVRDAARDYVVLNLLTKVGHLTRFPIHLATQVGAHFGTRPLAKAFEVAQLQGNTMASWAEISKAYSQEWEGFKAGLKPAWAGGRAEALGRGEGRNVDALMESMNTFGRLENQAKKYWDTGNYPMWLVTRLVGIPQYAGKWISVVDQWQGQPAVYADMLHQADLAGVEAGWSPAERLRFQGELVKTMKHEISQAMLETGLTLNAAGEKVTPKQIEENAWGLVKFRLHETMRNAGLPAGAIAETNEALRRQLAWQDEVRRGLGGPVAKGLQMLGKVLPPAGAFSNAIGHGLNWTLAKLPPGLHLLADFNFIGARGEEPSNFFRTSLDKKQRLIESIGATMAGGVLGGLLLNGMARYNPFIASAQERAEMEREGRKPGTIDFLLPDGSVSTWSLIVGPMTLLAPWIAGFGAAANLVRTRAQAQDRLNKEAARLGVQPGKIREIDAMDWLGVAGQAAVTGILGSKTAGGWTAQFVDPTQGFSGKRTVANQIQPFLPGLPGWHEVSRMMGIAMAQSRASVLDYLVPMPGSGARVVNVLGDAVGTRDDLQRVVQVLTGGSYPLPHQTEAQQDPAYAALINSGYHPPSVAPNKGYSINGVFRPFNDTELEKYAVERGKAFKAALTALGPNATKEQAQAAFEQADTQVLATFGAAPAKAAAAGAAAGAGNVPRGASISRPGIRSLSRTPRTGRGSLRSNKGVGRTGQVRVSYGQLSRSPSRGRRSRV